MILLTPKLVSQVIREEARRAGSSFDAVVNLGRRAKDISARTNALQRLMRETGCNREELAEAWGCSERTITNTLNPKPPPIRPRHDQTAERLRWAHGEERAAQILAGRDPATQTDITAWRRIGARAER